MMFRVLLAVFLGACAVSAESVPYKIGKYPQEVGHQFGTEEGLPAEEIHAIAVAADGAVYAGTSTGLAVLRDGAWKVHDGTQGKDVRVLARVGNDIHAGIGKTIYVISADGGRPLVDVPLGEITALGGDAKGVLAGTTEGIYRMDSSRQMTFFGGAAGPVAELAEHAAASATGLFDASGERISILDAGGRAWAVRDVLAVASSGATLWVATAAGLASGTPGGEWKFYTGREGLPYNEFTCAATGPDGEIWLGTAKGAIRFDGKDWNYRQGKTWLPDDQVNDIAVDGKGGAWIATPKGVAHIERRMMTLAEKAEHYEQEIEKYIKRTPFGYTSEVGLKEPGDRASGIIYEDSDNDGLWTSMYGAGECYAYAATKSPAAKERATKAFEALRFLQKVTQGGEFSPPKGYVARTIRSIDLPDPNIGRLAHDIAEQKGDKRWKAYEPRWPKSADGQWYWKSDTSSDELDGHYFFYPLYHDLVAETEAEKERVREVVRDLTDHMIKHDFGLMDIDGTLTRWAQFGPKSLNEDPYWWPERGLNSLSILSYLAVAEHITGDAKYGKAARELIDKHHYLQNLNFPKFQWGPGTGNQSDDEMAVMSFYNLVRYTKDDEVREAARYAFYRYWIVEFPEMNPFFNFAYAAVGLDKEVTDNWGIWSITPLQGWLEDSMDTLMGFPLDRCNWARKNSHRIDLQYFILDHNREPYEADGRGRGYRVNGKVLPVEERFFHHWNTDPWTLDYGGDGKSLASGAVFTLPYYMGLYHGFIEEAK